MKDVILQYTPFQNYHGFFLLRSQLTNPHMIKQINREAIMQKI